MKYTDLFGNALILTLLGCGISTPQPAPQANDAAPENTAPEQPAAETALPPIADNGAAATEEVPAGAGQAIATDPERGNCVACHQIVGMPASGDIGKPLVDIRARYPDREQLQQFLFDPRSLQADIVMPPYGRYEILTPQEIEQLIDFIYQL